MSQRALWDLGCYEISLGDTIGVGTPLKARRTMRAVARPRADGRISAMHFHDTYGQALANLYAGDGEGCRVIDSAPPAVSAAAPTRPVRPAMSRPRMWSTCWKAWGLPPASIWTSCVAATNVVSGLIGRPPVTRRQR